MALVDLIARVDNLKKEIDKFRPLKAEQERRILDKFRLDWNYHSNAIEGNRLTLGETRAFLLEGVTAHGKPLKDHLDIKGHNEVIAFLEGFIQRKEILTEATIRGLHEILLREPYEVEARTPEGGITKKMVKLGEYKTEQNFVRTGTGQIRYFLPPQDTSANMHGLMEWLKKETSGKSNHPLIVAGLFHHRFTQIHPFDDGNGRMARILMNLILMQNGFPPVIIKTQQRESYLFALVKADAGEHNELLELIADEEINSEEIYLRGANNEDISDFDDIDKKIALFKQQLGNVESPLVFTPEVQKDFFQRCTKLMVLRLAKKLNQFNDLFGSNTISISGDYIPAGTSSGMLTWSQQLANPQQIIQNLGIEIEKQNLFSNLHIAFNFEGFKKAGTNTFSAGFGLQFAFEKYKYRLTSYNLSPNVTAIDIYQKLPSEDEVLKMVNILTESFFEHIQKQMQVKA